MENFTIFTLDTRARELLISIRKAQTTSVYVFTQRFESCQITA